MILRIYTILFLFIFSISYGQLSFQDSATALGVGYTYGIATYGGGVSFCDFDGDGWDDITYATTDGEEVYFFKNNNGSFTLMDLGINDTYRTKQVTWVDYDNDGDKDFFATSISGLNKFYRNDGDLNFTDITNTCGLFTDNLFTYGASFGDIDNDGDLDIFISNRDEVTFNQYSYLYRNDSGTFVEVTSSAGLNLGNQLSFCSAFFDYDNDGDQDLYVANDKFNNINRLYQNDGTGAYTDVSFISGAGIAIDAMSTTIGDYNKDGWFDIYVTNTTGGNQMLRNNGDGTFTNVSPVNGTAFYSIGWGSVFLDADNDTDLDLYVSSSMDGTIPERLTSAFYENDGNNDFTIPLSIGFENDALKSFANAMGDFNNDGLPDIVVMNHLENNFLWENTTSNSNNWLKVNLEGEQSNRDGIGSRIEISINGEKQYRYTLCGEGYLGQNSGTEIFGLGDATTIDYIKVTWLSGIEDVFNDVSSNQSLYIIEGSSLSIDEFESFNLSIYPNPTNGIITISNITEDLKLTIINVLGEELIVKYVTSVNNIIDISAYPKGVYFFSFSNNLKSITKKIILK